MRRPAPSNLHGIARVLSKRGFCSRSEAVRLVEAGRVSVHGRVIKDADHRIRVDQSGIAVDGKPISTVDTACYIMLNKPRGLVTSASDELGRDTVYGCLEGQNLPRLVAVGRLDKASEGLLLFSNDTQWANHLTDPKFHMDKVYHVQVRPVPRPDQLQEMREGIVMEDGENYAVSNVSLLRTGGITAWLEITLQEGKNRQIRRILDALNFETLRLIRIAVGSLSLGELEKGKWRHLTSDELKALAG